MASGVRAVGRHDAGADATAAVISRGPSEAAPVAFAAMPSDALGSEARTNRSARARTEVCGACLRSGLRLPRGAEQIPACRAENPSLGTSGLGCGPVPRTGAWRAAPHRARMAGGSGAKGLPPRSGPRSPRTRLRKVRGERGLSTAVLGCSSHKSRGHRSRHAVCGAPTNSRRAQSPRAREPRGAPAREPERGPEPPRGQVPNKERRRDEMRRMKRSSDATAGTRRQDGGERATSHRGPGRVGAWVQRAAGGC